MRIPFKRHTGRLHPRYNDLNEDDVVNWANSQANHIKNKYKHKGKHHSKGNRGRSKRQQVGLGDYSTDSFYFAQVGLGTPQKTFNFVLDTGSADFWVASSACGQQNNCPNNIAKYDASKSSSHAGSNEPFSVNYGSGAVRGKLGADTVSLSNYTVSSLTFAEATEMAASTISAPASGIMGLGFETLSASGSTPFWQVLALQGKLQDPVFSFELARNLEKASRGREVNPGGVFTLGVLDDNQYTGDIAWTNLAKGYGGYGIGYWAIPLGGLSVNGHNMNLGMNAVAAIDTGTTLVAGPPQLVQQIYKQVPNAGSAGQRMPGYYTFPCKQDFTVTFTFNRKPFTLKNEDLNLGRISYGSDQCLGAIFEGPQDPSGNMPAWIIGDSFLKTVFSVFRYKPQSVGFASLKNGKAETLSLTSESPQRTQSLSPGAMGGGGGGLPTTTRTLNTQRSGLLGGNGLPTPSVVSTPATIRLNPNNRLNSAAAAAPSWPVLVACMAVATAALLGAAIPATA